MKKYEVVIETSPDQAGTYKIKIKAENKGEAEKKAEKWIKENHPHLIDMAMYTIQELNESKTMKKSELRQIIREEIQKEMFGLEAYGRGGLSISRYELEKNRALSDNPNNYYVMKAIPGSWPPSAELDLGGRKIPLKLEQQDNKFAVYIDTTTNFNPITITVFKK